MRFKGISALTATELTMIWRNKTVAVTAVGMPLATSGYFAFSNRRVGNGGWVSFVALQVLVMLLFSVYIAATTTLTARRQELFLKRLRSGEASDAVILLGTLLPVILLVFGQTLVLFGITTAAGNPPPRSVLLLLVAIFGGAVMCCAVAAVTSAITPSAETAQVTTAPFLFATFGGGLWVLFTPADQVSTLMLAAPGGAITDLIRRAWSTTSPTGGEPALLDQLAHAGPSMLALLVWTLVAAAVAFRLFRWEPRH